MIGMAVQKTMSEYDAIRNNFDSGSKDLVNILKEKTTMQFFAIVLHIYL